MCTVSFIVTQFFQYIHRTTVLLARGRDQIGVGTSWGISRMCSNKYNSCHSFFITLISTFCIWTSHIFAGFSFSSRWHCSARKGPYALCFISQQFPQGCPRNSANICLVEHIVLLLGGWNVSRFLSPLLFPSGDQCCDTLACPCSECSSSL